MLNLINAFTNQIKESIEIGEKSSFTSTNSTYSNVIICGLGGSGIGASLVSDLYRSSIGIPIIINKTYSLPAFADEKSLVIISSYSGNTEETLSAFKIAIEKKCKIVSISSNGEVEKISIKENIDFVKIPGGMPPRACLGYSTTQIFYTLNAFHLISDSYKSELNKSIQLLDSEKENIKGIAKNLAENFIGKSIILYSADDFESVAVRFRQQINENSKMLAGHNVVPEMNHNELVGWRIKDNTKAVLFIRNENDFSRTQSRMDLNKEIISKYTETVLEVWSKGNSNLEKSLYLINIGDWMSYYLSEMRGVDITEVKVIDYLKSELSKK